MKAREHLQQKQELISQSGSLKVSSLPSLFGFVVAKKATIAFFVLVLL